MEVELNVVDDEAIHEMNRQYRQIDRATDVLSFPLWDLTPGQAAAELSEDEADPETGHICLGKHCAFLGSCCGASGRIWAFHRAGGSVSGSSQHAASFRV